MKKKNYRTILLGSLAIAVTLSMSACGSKNLNTFTGSKDGSATEGAQGENLKVKNTDAESTVADGPTLAPDESTAADTAKQDGNDIPMVSLPQGISGMKSETKPDKKIRDIIIKDMEIPEDFYDTTNYFYNYVDLNDDGTKEIFVMVTGMYTSGSGGSSALLLSENGGELHVMQDFTLVNGPVVISDKVENGYHDIIVPYYINNESNYSVLSYKDGAYPNIPNGNVVKNLDGVKGNAILANDRLKEADAGIMGISLSAE